MLADQTIRQLIERVAARTPTPGGGSVAALAGAFGAALGAMGARYTIGRGGTAEAELTALVSGLEDVSRSFLSLADEDAAAYERVVTARRLPKESPDEREKRKAALDEAFRAAVETPQKTLRLARDLAETLARLAPSANPNLVTDLAVGAILAEAAFEGARLNVLVNLPSIADASFREKAAQEAETIGRAVRERKADVVGRTKLLG